MRTYGNRWRSRLTAVPHAQVTQIAASIEEWGFNNPILVDANEGGHGRLLAARKLGLLQVPVILLDHLLLDHLTKSQQRAYLLAGQFHFLRDNKFG